MAIDVKPGGGKNPINLKSKGVLPIAILTTQDSDGQAFDATTVDISTIQLNGISVSPVRFTFADIDGDGDEDLLLHFRTQELVSAGVLDEDSTELTLTAENTLGGELTATDTVSIVPPKGKGKRGR